MLSKLSAARQFVWTAEQHRVEGGMRVVEMGCSGVESVWVGDMLKGGGLTR